MEARVSGVLIEVDVRPSAIGTLDGGLRNDVELGFDAYVEGWRQPDVMQAAGSGKMRQVVRSEVLSFDITAGEVDATYYPSRYSAYLPCRLDDQVRSVRVGLLNVRGVEVVSVELYGQLLPSRLG
jgi:hypothetical protein